MWPAKEGGKANMGCWRCLLLEKKEEKNERERRSGGVYIKGKFKIITSCHWNLKQRRRRNETCVSLKLGSASRPRRRN